MKPLSPGKSDRLTGFATIVKAGREMTRGRRRNWLALVVPSLVLVAAISHFTAVRAAARPSTSGNGSGGGQQTTGNSGNTNGNAGQTTGNSGNTNGNAGQTTGNSGNTNISTVTTGNVISSNGNTTQTTVNCLDTNVNAIKSTLDQIPPAWSQILPAADRFRLVMCGAAVLDKETGLVWEQSPDTTTRDWFNAEFHCNVSSVGGRKGWRLPTIQELASLIDPIQSNPALPPGHPFSNVRSSHYWSATSTADGASFAWVVDFHNGDVGVVDDKLHTYSVWCVRGGQGVDLQ